MQSLVEWELAGETEVLGETSLSATLSTTNSRDRTGITAVWLDNTDLCDSFKQLQILTPYFLRDTN
jgi:hypothetical protein